MMKSNDVRYVVTVDDQGAIKKFQQIDDVIHDSQRTGEKAHSAFSQLWKGFAAGQIVVDGIRKGFGLLKAELRETVAQAINAERVDRALESSLSLVSGTSSGAATSLKLYASALQRQTIYGDEAIKSAMSLIIQMRGTASQIDEATRGAIGLASVFQMDLQSAARAVALGFAGNYRQLGQLIPAIRDAKTETEKQAAMTDFLAKAYQRAKDDAQTFGGKLDALKEAYGDLQETIGGFVTKNKDVIATLSGVKEIIIWIDRWAQNQKSGKSSLQNPLNWTVFGALPLALRKLGEAATEANKEWAESWEGHTAAMLAFRKQALDPLPVIIKETLPYVDSLVDRFNRLDDDLRMFRMLGGFEIDTRFKESFGTLGDVAGGFYGNLINYQEKAADGLFDFLRSGAKETKKQTDRMSDMWAGSMNSIAAGFTHAFMQFRLTAEGFKNFFLDMWQAIKQAFFQVIAEMIAKWLVFKVIMTGLKIAFAPATGGASLAVPMQHGFHGVISRPTPILVGEAGPERVDVSPIGRSSHGGGGTTTVNFYIQTLDADRFESVVRYKIVPILKEIYVHGSL